MRWVVWYNKPLFLKDFNMENTVKNWHSFLGDNKPKHNQCCLFILKGECDEYPTLTDVGLVKIYSDKMRIFSLSEPESQLNQNNILAWMPYEYPSEKFILELIEIDKNGYSKEVQTSD